MKILGVKVDNLGKEDILKKISLFLSEENFHQVATINPEFILKAQKDEEFKNILNSCDLNIADGMGIKLAFWRMGERLRCRMAGIDLMQEILKIANEKKLKIFLAANSGGLSTWEETKDVILKKYPNLEIGGANLDRNNLSHNLSRKGGTPPRRWQPVTYNLIFCNFGAPFQEKFLNSLKNDTIGLAVGVGGSFDYLTGKLKRAPKWMQFFGVEWFWRLLLQPKRIKRIFNAVIIFPIKIIIK